MNKAFGSRPPTPVMASNFDPDLEQSARAFADFHHKSKGQKRRATGDDYIVHPDRVVSWVRSVPHTSIMVAAAYLHDTIEDTDATAGDLVREFGSKVAELVAMLTDTSTAADGNRAARKAVDRCRRSLATPQGKTIMLGDMIDNLEGIITHEPRFAPIYVEEKALLLDVIRAGDKALWDLAHAIVQGYRTSITHS